MEYGGISNKNPQDCDAREPYGGHEATHSNFIVRLYTWGFDAGNEGSKTVGLGKRPTMTLTDSALPHRFSLDHRSGDQSLAEWCAEFADRYRKTLLTTLILFCLCGFNGHWQLGPDSALYLTLGRNLATGRGYTYHGLPHGMVYPGLPFALAGLFNIFHSRSAVIVAADGLMLLCGLGVLAATYRLVFLAFDRPSAVVVTLGVGITREFYRYCFEILTDMPFLLGVMMFLAGQEAIFQSSNHRRRIRWTDWTLLVGGLMIAMITRPTMIGLLAVWMISMLWTAVRSKNSRPLAIAAASLGLLVTILFVHFDPRHAAGAVRSESYENTVFNDLTSNFHQRLNVDVPANLHDLFGLSAARSAFGMPLGTWWLNAIFGSIFLAAGLALFRKRPLWGLWIGITVVILIFIQSHDRYMLQILPLLVLGWWRMLLAVNRSLPRKIGNAVFVALLAMGTIPNMMQSGYLAIRQHETPFLAKYRDGEYFGYSRMAEAIPQYAAPDQTILCPTKLGRILTFLSDRNVYEPSETAKIDLAHVQPLVVFDPNDPDLLNWMTSQHLHLDANPLVSIPRGKSPPLQLFRTHLQG